jgi:hypothetical protein
MADSAMIDRCFSLHVHRHSALEQVITSKTLQLNSPKLSQKS